MTDQDLSPFAQRAADLLGSVSLRELPDDVLVATVLDPTNSPADVVEHRYELVRRHRGMIVQRSTKACSRLAHAGQRCPGHRCDAALPSAAGAVSERLVGRRVHTTNGQRGTLDISTATPPQGRRQPGLAVLTGWVDARAACTRGCSGSPSEQLSLARYFGGALKLSGLDTEARRRWNSDRGLVQRIQPPAKFKSEWARRLAEFEQTAGDRGDAQPLIELFELMDRSLPERDPIRWATVLYDDLCDHPSETVERGHDIGRVGRRIFPPADPETDPPSHDAVERLVGFVRSLVDVVDEAAGTKVGAQLDRAEAMTRSGGAEFLDARGHGGE